MSPTFSSSSSSLSPNRTPNSSSIADTIITWANESHPGTFRPLDCRDTVRVGFSRTLRNTGCSRARMSDVMSKGTVDKVGVRAGHHEQKRYAEHGGDGQGGPARGTKCGGDF